MDWKSVGKTVAKAAPILGTVLGGPVGAVAGAAGSLLASFLGVEPDPQAVAQAVRDPETMLKLKELEAAHQARLLDWQTKQLEAEVENVKSARAREVELAKAGHGGAWATTVVAGIVTVGFFIMLYLVLRPPENFEIGQAATLLLGSLATGFGAVVNYYLGSSLGSTRKTAMLQTRG